jgi:hypothetical protein
LKHDERISLGVAGQEVGYTKYATPDARLYEQTNISQKLVTYAASDVWIPYLLHRAICNNEIFLASYFPTTVKVGRLSIHAPLRDEIRNYLENVQPCHNFHMDRRFYNVVPLRTPQCY